LWSQFLTTSDLYSPKFLAILCDTALA